MLDSPDPGRLSPAQALQLKVIEEREAFVASLAIDNPPTRQQSYQRTPVALPGMMTGVDSSWQAFQETNEFVPALRWPQSIRTYEQMRTDSQLSGLYRAMTMPIRRFKWLIEPNGSRPAIVNGLADDLNLDIVGQEPRPRGRQKNRFDFTGHLTETLLSLIYGHRFFELVGEIVPAQRFPGNQRWRLRKLPLIPSDTIELVNVAQDGGLVSVAQKFSTGILRPEPIPVSALIAYPWEKEGANWLGRSILRDCYKNWVIKDKLVRVDAINHERAGGIHIAKGPPGATPSELQKLSEMAQSARVDESGGGAVPYGGEYEIHKVGSGTDVINSVRYHDEAMARLFLHMFLQLGQTTTGSRALGEVFVEYAYIAQKTVANWFRDVTNAHLIEDWVDINWGNTEQVPLLTYVVEEETDYMPVEDLVSLIAAGAISVDPELEEYLRSRFKLPRLTVVPPEGVSAAAWEDAKLRIGETYERAVTHLEEKGDKVSRKDFLARLVRAA